MKPRKVSLCGNRGGVCAKFQLKFLFCREIRNQEMQISKLTVMYSSNRCFQLSLRFIRWLHCSVSLATSRRMLLVRARFGSSPSKAVRRKKRLKRVIREKCQLYKPSESLVSETGGSLATYCLPLSKLLSTIGLLSSSWRLNALWSSLKETKQRKSSARTS